MEKIFYLAHIFEALRGISVFVLACSFIALAWGIVWRIEERHYDIKETSYESDKKDAKITKKMINTSLAPLIVSILLLVFVPSKKTYLYMVGGNALEEIAKNERVQETASKTIDLLDRYLDDKLGADSADNEVSANE